MRVERLFSRQQLRPAPGVYDRGGADATAGALSALQTTGAARSRAASRIEAAQANQTRGLVAKGAAQKDFATSLNRFGQTVTGVAEILYKREEEKAEHNEVANAALIFRQHFRARAEQIFAGEWQEPHAIVDQLKRAGDDILSRMSRTMSEAAHTRLVGRVALLLPMEMADVGAKAFKLADANGKHQFSRRRATYVNEAKSSDDPRRQILALRELSEDRNAMVALGALGQGEAIIQQLADRETVWRHVVERWSRNDPELAVELLDRGVFDHLQPNEVERSKVRRDLLAATKALGMDGVNAAHIDRRLELFEQGEFGEADAALAREIEARGTPEQRRDFKARSALASEVGSLRTQIRYESFSAQAERLTQAKAAGGVKHEAAVRACRADLTDWHDDPALMARAHPAARSVSGLIAVQRHKGVPQPSCYTKAQAASVVASLNGASPAERREILDRQRKYCGPEVNAALRDLTAAGLGFADRIRIIEGDNPNAARLLGNIEAAENTELKELQGAVSREERAGIDKALAPALAPYLEIMAPALEGGGLAAQRDDVVRLARKLTLAKVIAGQEPERAVARTVAELFGERYRVADGVRVPHRYDSGLVLAHAEKLRGQPLTDFAPDPRATGAALPDGVSVEDWRADIAARGRFATTPDDRGAELLTPDGLPVRNASGNPFGLSFDSIAPEDNDWEDLVRRHRWSQQAGRSAAGNDAWLWLASSGGKPPDAPVGPKVDRDKPRQQEDEETGGIAGWFNDLRSWFEFPDPPQTQEEFDRLRERVLDLPNNPDELNDVRKALFNAYGEAGRSENSKTMRLLRFAKRLASGRGLDEGQLAELNAYLTVETADEERRLVPALDREKAQWLPGGRGGLRRLGMRSGQTVGRPKPRSKDSFFEPNAEKARKAYQSRRTSGVPAGFRDLQQVKDVTKGMLGTLDRAGVDARGVTIVVRGSAATGHRASKHSGKYTDDERFDSYGRASDIDFAISGNSVVEKVRKAGIKFDEYGRTQPLTPEQVRKAGLPGLVPTRVNGVKRKSSIVIFDSVAKMKEAPHIVLYDRGRLSPLASDASINPSGQ